MKTLISTTAIAALLALPVMAQEATTGQQTGQQQPMQQGQDTMQGQQMAQAGMMEIEASQLIGKRLYIQREGEQGAGLGMQQQGQTGQAMQGDQQQAGQAEQQLQQDQQGQTAQTDQQQMQPGQQDQTAQTDQQQVQPGQQDQTAQTGMESGQAGQQQMTGQQMSGQQMVGMEQGVTNPREHWQTAGQITDVLLSQEGEVQALVIDAGGFLGGGQGDRRIDVQEVQFVPHAEDQNEFFVVYTGDRQTFEQAQMFDDTQPMVGQERGTAVWGDQMRGQQAEISPTAITSDELVGTSIYGPNDDWVGDVSDLAMTEDGQIEAVIVDVGGFLGIGTRSVALSMEQLQLRRGEGGWFGDDLRAYVNATQEELEQLPEWEEPS
jgi:hypothetical protein